MVICLEQGADLHTAQLMPLPLTVSCFSEIQIGLTFLVLVHPGSPGKRAVKRVCVCVCVCVYVSVGPVDVPSYRAEECIQQAQDVRGTAGECANAEYAGCKSEKCYSMA